MNSRQNAKDFMNTLLAKGRWNIAKGKLTQKLTCLTEEDFQFAEEELLGRIQKRKAQEMSPFDSCSTSHPQTR
jgi:hypothetical protein